MPFTYTANRGVAAHSAKRLYAMGKKQGIAAHTRRSQRRLGASMPPANYNHIEFFRVPHGLP
jgi:hypothetical protein